LSGIDHWLRHLLYSHDGVLPTILVSARTDRGTPTLTDQELQEYCGSQRIVGAYVGTSAEPERFNWD